jgi:hypothetical protein
VSTPTPPLRAWPGPSLGTSRGFTSQGPVAHRLGRGVWGVSPHRDRRLSLFSLRARFVPFGLLLARCRMRGSPGGDPRSRELRPNPIRSDTSRHDTVAPPVGDRISLAGAAAGPKPRRPAADLNGTAARASVLAKKRGLAGPRASHFRRPPAVSFPPSRLSTGLDGRNRRTETVAGTTHRAGWSARQCRSARLDALAACAAGPSGPRVASRDAPRRAARSAAPEVPSIESHLQPTMSGSRPASCSRWGLFHRLSPACG